ncbi:MAG: MFS transporter [Peptococcaceae bacterium]|nr:MFS transporter [Peptococcaceae bacterium]
MPKMSQTFSKYRWVILFLVAIINFTFNACQFQVAALAYKLIPEYGLTPSQYASVLNAPMLVAVFFCLFAGSLGDRFGIKRVISAGLLIGTTALFLRVLADNYLELFLSMLMMGLIMPFVGANFAKLVGLWFPKKQIGLAFGIFFFIGMAGNTVSLIVTTYFPSIFSAFLTSAFVMMALCILWIILARDKPAGVSLPPPMPLKNYTKAAARSKNVWLGGFLAMLYMGATLSFTGFLPAALNSVHGLSPSTAGFWTSVFTLGNMIGGFIGPLLVDRVGTMKPVIIILALTGAAFTYLSWISPVGVLMGLSLLLGGTLTGAILPNINTLPLRFKEIGPVYAGSAGGIIATMQVTGAFFIPTFVISTIAGQNYNLLFILASLAFLLIAPVTTLLPTIRLREKSQSATFKAASK